MNNGKFYIESYGCQMNFSDSEIIASVMKKNNFLLEKNHKKSDIIFINTCSIRKKAEERIEKRISQFNEIKKKNKKLIIGILGCMAKRMKFKLFKEKKTVDLIIGPDSYRNIPKLINNIKKGKKAYSVLLSKKETYEDINPVKINSNKINSFISIMRGCNNMCSFCIVPFTRGRERSRNPDSIIKEVKYLFIKGYREVTLLGQNVDSYNWKYKNKKIINFSKLISMIADINKDLRVRFSTSHPKDITSEVLYTIKKYENICNHIHLPVQSGNDRILKLMNRGYSRLWYLNKIKEIKTTLLNKCSISSDIITGFCSEKKKEHEDTLSLMDNVKYNFSYMFYYSERPGTLSQKKYKDDIPLEIKRKRLNEIIKKQLKHSLENNKKDINKIYKTLIEGYSKRSKKYLQGRNSENKIIIFPNKKEYKKGKYVDIKIKNCTSATLFGD